MIIHNHFQGDGEEIWKACQKLNCNDFILVNISNLDWNDEMTPWESDPIILNEQGYKGKANQYLKLLDDIIKQMEQKLNYKPLYYAIAGYSLGGLLAIYSMYQTNRFLKIISVSSSLWYPNFLEFVENNAMFSKPKAIYFSLGDKEKNTKISPLNRVQEHTEKMVQIYQEKEILVFYELNPGGHFKDYALRIAKGIKWILLNEEKKEMMEVKKVIQEKFSTRKFKNNSISDKFITKVL